MSPLDRDPKGDHVGVSPCHGRWSWIVCVGLLGLSGGLLSGCTPPSGDPSPHGAGAMPLLGPAHVEAPSTARPSSAQAVDLNGRLAADPRLATTARLIHQGGISDILRNDGPYTLLAPTESCYAALSPRRRAALEADPGRVYRLLAHHVLLERVSLDGATPASTLAEGHLSPTQINALGLGAPIEASNGVILPVERFVFDDLANL